MPLNETDPVRVLIVGDDFLIRAGLRTVLCSDNTVQIEVEAVNGYCGLELAPRLEPGVILLDLRIHQFDGSAALEQLQTQDSAPMGTRSKS